MSVCGKRENRTFDTREAANLWIAERALARKKGMPVEPAVTPCL
jgi:hypothetical protein